MRFGPVPVEEAVGAVSAHALKAGDTLVKKGTVVSAEQADALRASGIGSVVAARLDREDVGEDEAAHRLAVALAGSRVRVAAPFTGRANLFAAADGILRIERDGIDLINGVDEALTVATLPAFRAVRRGEMVGTVKVIPYAVPGDVVGRAVDAARPGSIDVAPYRLRGVGAISTLLPSLKASTVTKTIGALRRRLAPAAAEIVAAATCAHETEALAAALAAQGEAELIVVFGASAIADRRDVIPAAIERAGGRIEHFGMPVDPGNLLLIAELLGRPVIGAPGCARSPRENGFDWVLGRMLAGLPVRRADIVGMGVGGLLMEIGARGQPRAGDEA